MESSFDIEGRLLKFSVVILDIIMQGNVYLGTIVFVICDLDNDVYKFLLNVSCFLT